MDSPIKIDKLPISVLINIFSFIRKTPDYKSIRSVCKRFHKLLPMLWHLIALERI